ncbi:MAG TPA: trehalase family glycosidase, partial [Tepidisphaeraceae bacterium]|nr:trehalase family glycosidase [Tepidisphaeraceae bacterium]
IVYHYGNGRHNPDGNTFYWSRGGFICQLDLPEQRIQTDSSWLTRQSRAWKKDVPKIDRMTYSEFFDARLDPHDWLEPDFAPGPDWSPAVVVELDPLVAQWNWNPSPSAVMPWIRLEPRGIPPFQIVCLPEPALLYSGEVLERAEPNRPDDLAIRMSLEPPLPSRYTRIEHVQPLRGEDELRPMVLHPMSDDYDYDDFPGIHDPCLGYDAGRMLNGRVRIDLSAPAGTIVDIGYAQILVDGRVLPYLSNRTPVADQFITRQGRQTLETYNWRNFRYFQLTFRRMSAPLRIHSIRVFAERYPFQPLGRFECDDEMLNWVWKACADTTELCIHDRLMDNPFRERREYAGDLLGLATGVYAAFGPTEIIRKYHDDMLHSWFTWGMFPHTVMGNRNEAFSIYSDSALILILHFWQHYELFADVCRLRQFYPKLVESLRLLELYENEQGLIGRSPFTMYVDWADLERRGYPLIVNCLHVEALRVLARMAEVLGHREDAAAFQSRYEQLKTVIQTVYWDRQRGVYSDALVDQQLCQHTSEHVNFLMMMFGLADPQQQQAIHRAIGQPDIRIGQVEPSFIWALEGLFRTGYDQWALDILRRRYRRMRRQGLTTIAELWNLLGERYTGRWRSRDTRSAVQGSGVTAAYLLSRFVLGVHPLRPGFAQVLICPAPGDLKQAS